MSKPELWRANADLCKVYGDVVYVPVLGQSTILLGSQESISDLLDKRSAITSDRQESPLVALLGQDHNMGFMPYGQQWRRHRQAFTREFTSSVNPTHLANQGEIAHLLLKRLLKEPENLCEHIRYAASASVVKSTYGIELAGKDDRNVALMESVLQSAQAFAPGRFLVQYLPVLAYVPYWTPVAGPQLRELDRWRGDAYEVKQALFDISKSRRGCWSGPGSMLEKVEGQQDPQMRADEEEIAKNVAITCFEAGADSTISMLQSFFLAMSLNPDVQRKAQAELDAVIGPHRLPNHDDTGSLPYVNAIVRESLRWQGVSPFGIAHYTNEDLEYRGWFIPKGTVLLPQIWTCMHDPKVYPEPDRFLPDRFIRDGKLDPSVRDPRDFVFGFGRRICPGRHFAEAGLFINMAMILHVFDITPPMDENGKEIIIEPKLTGSFLTYPEDCRCTVKPRSAQAEALIVG
ncbi:cytochrome P450 [Earliella scabrosa]|nr:cytochrome P450 [Earliella scabrosa]